MPNQPSQNMTLPFVEPKKRGLIRFFSAFFWLSPLDSFPLASIAAFLFTSGGLASFFKKDFSGGLTTLAVAGAFGGLAYWQWTLLEKGTSPFKKLFGMQVLKWDPKLHAYRKCTPGEYIARDVIAMCYFPISFVVMSIPALVGGVLAGGLRQASIGDDSHKHQLIREYNERQVQAATAAGAAAGVAMSYTLIQKFPWILALHDSVMKTMVVSVDKEQAKYFADGGVFQTGHEVKPFSQAA